MAYRFSPYDDFYPALCAMIGVLPLLAPVSSITPQNQREQWSFDDFRMSKKVVANETMLMMAMMEVTVLLMIMILVLVSLVVVLCGGGVQRWVCLFASDCLEDHATTQQSIAEERMCSGHN